MILRQEFILFFLKIIENSFFNLTKITQQFLRYAMQHILINLEICVREFPIFVKLIITGCPKSKCQKVNKFFGRLNVFLGYSMALDMFKTS